MQITSNRPAVESAHLQKNLERRMQRPQRHRLLHGFPLAAAMPFADTEVRSRAAEGDVRYRLAPQKDRGLLVGVLPHTFCNPKVAACGYCTFPHEQYSSLKAAAVIAGVIREIDSRVTKDDSLVGRQIDGLYFGGGTANLSPAEPFRQLCKKLNSAFDLSRAEVTLEGVPAYFIRRKPLLIDILLEELNARHFRISMGVQTFSRELLEHMGRLAFGDAETFSQVVHDAQERGMTTSMDLMVNLPGQTLAAMRQDISRAIDTGVDQICLYHLVMYRGLGTPWARDHQLLSSLPDNTTAASNWVELRELVIASGYYQTTLTNFEKCGLRDSSRRYQYELNSFQPDRFNMLGFGPAGISYAALPGNAALKTMNPESSSEYLQAVDNTKLATWNRYFEFGLDSLGLLQATRNLAALRIDRDRYRSITGEDVSEFYRHELEILEDARLIEVDAHGLSPTPRGMFYSDTIASILAERHLRVGHNRLGTSGIDFPSSDRYQGTANAPPVNDNDRGYM